jgi:PST family polysaccharide transporter
VTKVGLATFSRLQGDEIELRRAAYRVAGLSAALTLPAYAGLAIVAPQIVDLVFGAKWERSVGIMQVLCIAGGAQAVTSFTHPLVIALGKVRNELRWNLAACGVLLAGFGASVHFGIVAVAWSLAIGSTILVPVRVVLMRRWAGISVRSYFARLLGPGTATAVMVLGVLAVVHALRGRGSIVGLICEVGAGVVLYIVSLAFVDRKTAKAVTGAVRSLYD